jgi:sigma-E factor negative regulatory protein RseA
LGAGLASVVAVAAITWAALGGAGSVGSGGAPTGPQLVQAPGARSASDAASTLVAQQAPESASTPAESAGKPVVDQAAAAEPVMLRDPRLDELLAAHRAAASASALGNTAVFLRNATFEGAER